MKYEKSCGAVVWRRENGQLLFLVEHMKQGHCSIPKGHMEHGETERETALREILEETSLSVTLDMGFRRTIRYSPAPDVEKDVVFFAAEALPGRIIPQECEVAAAEFLPPAQAMAAMTFDSDRETLRLALEYLQNT